MAEYLTKQEIFDKVKKHLLEQGEHAMEDLECRYRTAGGLKCAVGCLIPDKIYNPSIEGLMVEDLDPKYLPEVDPLDAGSFGLLEDLQYVHDEYPTDIWEEELEEVREEHNLE